MIKYLITLVFVLSVAIAAGSILISSKLRNTYKAEFLSTLLYFQAFYFTFGFYAIWGQVILVTFLSPFIANDLLNRTTNILVLLGAPFVLITWLMLIKFSRELSGRKTFNSFIFWFISGNILLVTGTGYLISRFTAVDPAAIIRYAFIILNSAYSLVASVSLFFTAKRKTVLRSADNEKTAIGLVFVMLLQNVVLAFYNGNTYISLVFIFVFFAGGAFVPVYIRYLSDLSVLFADADQSLSLDAICKKFEISPREKEIIREICKGLSNQQIADRLFISLQTVKDHTHRIYYKTNCSSRAELITMINSKTQVSKS